MTVSAKKRRSRPHAHRRRGDSVRGAKLVLGAIDVGTNACRLLIAVPPRAQNDNPGSESGGAGVPRVIDSFTASVRLGEGLERHGAFSEAALERTISALKTCAEHMHRYGVTHVKAIATEACRRAANAPELVARARAEAGLHLEVVTPEEEAHLAAEGCLPLIGADHDGALVFDIGGGSTELILVRKETPPAIGHAVSSWASVPVGVVGLAERHGVHNLKAAMFEPMRAEIAEAFAKVRAKLGPDASQMKRFHLLGTSGTLTTLAGVKLGLPRYRRSRIDGQWLTREDVRGIIGDIVSQEFEGRAAIPCIGDDRADLILPGCAILSTIMDNWPCDALRVADRGLREGLLIGLLREAQTPITQSA